MSYEPLLIIRSNDLNSKEEIKESLDQMDLMDRIFEKGGWS